MKMCRVLIISVINLSLSEVSFQLLEMTCIKEIQNQAVCLPQDLVIFYLLFLVEF